MSSSNPSPAPPPPWVPPQRQQQEPWAPPSPPHPQPGQRNGLGLAALIVGLVGCLFGLVPLTGFIAIICALVAIPLGIAGMTRIRHRQATNSTMTGFGLAAGVLALVLGIWGVTILVGATNRLVDDLESIGDAPTAGAPLEAGVSSAADAAVVGFGQRATFESGISVDVRTPEAFTPSEYALGHDKARAIAVTTTVVNDSDQPYEFNTMMVGPVAVYAGAPASTVYDAKVTTAPVSTVLPGKSLTYVTVLSIDDGPGELQLEYRTDFLGDSVYFLGQV